MTRLRRKKVHKSNEWGKTKKTKRRTKDIDQIFDEFHGKIKSQQEIVGKDEDLPGQGDFFCIACSRYFISQKVLEEHNITRPHKRRVAKLKKEKPYTGPDLLIDHGKPLNRNNAHPASNYNFESSSNIITQSPNNQTETNPLTDVCLVSQ